MQIHTQSLAMQNVNTRKHVQMFIKKSFVDNTEFIHR